MPIVKRTLLLLAMKLAAPTLRRMLAHEAEITVAFQDEAISSKTGPSRMRTQERRRVQWMNVRLPLNSQRVYPESAFLRGFIGKFETLKRCLDSEFLIFNFVAEGESVVARILVRTQFRNCRRKRWNFPFCCCSDDMILVSEGFW